MYLVTGYMTIKKAERIGAVVVENEIVISDKPIWPIHVDSDGQVRFSSVQSLFFPNAEPELRFRFGHLLNLEPEPAFRFGSGSNSVRTRIFSPTQNVKIQGKECKKLALCVYVYSSLKVLQTIRTTGMIIQIYPKQIGRPYFNQNPWYNTECD
jgi:hypothetical protein